MPSGGLAFARVAIVFVLAWAATRASDAQVFGSGPSDSALFTNGVFNVPPDNAPVSVGNLQQLNVSDGGAVGSFFDAFSGSEVNISGGSVGPLFTANSGSEVNLAGGVIGPAFEAKPGSEVNISGGVVQSFFQAEPGSDVELIGGEFRVGGAPFDGSTVTLAFGEILTGTLQDGSAFIFSPTAGDEVVGVTLTSVGLPTRDATPIVINTPLPNRPSGLRAGQTLTLQAGGQLGEHFEAFDSTLNIEGGVLGATSGIANGVANISGGSVGDRFDAFRGSVVNLSGGSVGNGFDVFPGSELNITGGSIGAAGGSVVSFGVFSGSVVNFSAGSIENDFVAFSGSEVNLFGTEFLIDGEQVSGLTSGEAFAIADRGVTLTGLLTDGSAFSFDLNPALSITQSSVSPDATLTVTLVDPAPPAPGDFNGDRLVNAADFPVLRDLPGDLPANFVAFASNFGGAEPRHAKASIAAAPEPAALPPLLFGVLFAVGRRRFG